MLKATSYVMFYALLGFGGGIGAIALCTFLLVQIARLLFPEDPMLFGFNISEEENERIRESTIDYVFEGEAELELVKLLRKHK